MATFVHMFVDIRNNHTGDYIKFALSFKLELTTINSKPIVLTFKIHSQLFHAINLRIQWSLSQPTIENYIKTTGNNFISICLSCDFHTSEVGKICIGIQISNNEEKVNNFLSITHWIKIGIWVFHYFIMGK